MGLAHPAQALATLLLASAVSLPVTINYLIGPPGAGDFGGPKELFDVRVDIAVAAFLLLAAIDHLSVGTWGRRWYERQVSRGINPARWWEYSISASLMVVLIAMLAGVREGTALVALFGANAAMILFGLTMERVNVGSEWVQWRPFIYGCLIGAVPWIAIALQLAVSQNETGNVPGFAIAIFVTLLLLFSSFAVNMWLQYCPPRPLGGPAVCREGLSGLEPGGQERPCLASLRRRAGRKLTRRRAANPARHGQ